MVRQSEMKRPVEHTAGLSLSYHDKANKVYKLLLLFSHFRLHSVLLQTTGSVYWTHRDAVVRVIAVAVHASPRSVLGSAPLHGVSPAAMSNKQIQDRSQA